MDALCQSAQFNIIIQCCLTNFIVENSVRQHCGRIEDLLGQTRFSSASHLKDSLLKYNQLYNHHIAQKLSNHLAATLAVMF